MGVRSTKPLPQWGLESRGPTEYLQGIGLGSDLGCIAERVGLRGRGQGGGGEGGVGLTLSHCILASLSARHRI